MIKVAITIPTSVAPSHKRSGMEIFMEGREEAYTTFAKAQAPAYPDLDTGYLFPIYFFSLWQFQASPANNQCR